MLKNYVTRVILAALLLFSLAATPAFANEYAIVSNMTTNEGGYFSAPNVSMNSNWSTSFPCRFINKTHWLRFDGAHASYDDWLEVGRTHGKIEDATGTVTCGGEKVKLYDAYYTAYGTYDSAGVLTYEEFPVTGFSTTGTHNYQIQRTGTGQWKAYVDFTAVRTYTWNFSSSTGQDIGWEANTTAATWTAPNYSTSHQLLISGSWRNWSTGVYYDYSTGHNVMGWYADCDLNPDLTTNYSKATYWE